MLVPQMGEGLGEKRLVRRSYVMGGGGQLGIGVLLVRDETPLFMDAMAKALALERSIRLLSRPLTIDAARIFCLRSHPDVVLVEATELAEPALLGFVQWISEACDGAPVVLLANTRVDDPYLVSAIEAGAFGLVDGTAGIDEVVTAVQAAAGGRRLVDADRFLNAVEATARTRHEERDRVDKGRSLTEREWEVLRGLKEGLRNSEIARQLSISPRTVDKHVEHILRKLEASSRLHAVALAARMEDLAYAPMRGTA
jgi:DNA-binding NarL/FixJ family response regulator